MSPPLQSSRRLRNLGLVASWACAVALCSTPSTASSRGPVIDVHVHTSPERFHMVAAMLANNDISRFVNLSGGALGKPALEETLEAARDYDGRILNCANVNWSRVDAPGFAEEQARLLTEAARKGAACLKISKALGLFVPDPSDAERLMAVDDPRLDPLWAAAGRLGLPVMMHTGDPKAFFEPATPQNERWAELQVHPSWSFADARYPRREALLAARDRLLRRHRGTTFVGVHFANNPEELDYVRRALTEHPNLYVDVAARLPEIGRHPAEAVRALLIEFQDRVLFGTDLGVGQRLMLGSTGRSWPRLPDVDLFYHDHYRWFESGDEAIPHPTPIQGDWRIDAVALPDDVQRKIYHLNALKLFWKQSGPDAVDEAALREAPGYAEFHEM